MEHVHLIGIGGSGLSAIARILLERGVVVSGSDRQASAITEALQAAGARVFIGHEAINIQGADIVVRSSAVPDDNVEVQTALGAGIPVLKRSEFLGSLLEGYKVIAVAGTHGKTTTTAMLSWSLTTLGKDPSYVIGGEALDLGTNAHAGEDNLFVIEADEYDRMFLGLRPDVAVVTNIEHDHPDCYPTPEDFYQAFHAFADRLAPQGILLACIDDPGARRLSEEARLGGHTVRSYGLNHWAGQDGPNYAARDLEINPLGGFSFDFVRQENPSSAVHVVLQVPGRHNVSNALAAMAVIDYLALPVDRAAASLGRYSGTGRRFEVRGESHGVTVIDDYAHHPSEIRATLAAARSRYPERSVWVVWQPHTYSRTRALLDDFATSFGDAEQVIVTDIYAAREPSPANGFSSRDVVEALKHPNAHYLPDFSQVANFLLKGLHPEVVVLVLSAGDANQVSDLLLHELR
jgi:UDP-N-acetylmuramate--alanine ligase